MNVEHRETQQELRGQHLSAVWGSFWKMMSILTLFLIKKIIKHRKLFVKMYRKSIHFKLNNSTTHDLCVLNQSPRIYLVQFVHF